MFFFILGGLMLLTYGLAWYDAKMAIYHAGFLIEEEEEERKEKELAAIIGEETE